MMKILIPGCLLVLLFGVAVAQRRYRQDSLSVSDGGTFKPAAYNQAEDLACDGTIQFELITGYVYSSADDIINSRHRTLKLSDCIESCRNSSKCRAVNFETGLCIMFKTSAGENSASLAVSQLPVFTLYAQKVCLSDNTRAAECSTPWAFESTPGMALSEGFIVDELETPSRLQCALLCLNANFDCRAASFDSSTKMCSMAEVNRNMAGRRQLLRMDQSSDVIETSCQAGPKKMCEFQAMSGKILKTVDSVYQDVEDIEACKQRCLEEDFGCVSYDFMSADTKICRLSHHSRASLSHIQDPYIEVESTVTYEMGRCYQVDVECRATEMVTKIETSTLFDGKVYVKSRPNTCVVDVENTTSIEFTLPYSDLKCDVRREAEGTFLSNIVIQHHDMIVTSADIGLALHCKYDLQNATVTNSLFSGLEVKDGIVTEHIKETIVSSPNVTMTITTLNEEEVFSAQVGDNLALRFEILDLNSPYEIFVRELVAMDGQDSSEIVLIDHDGCPTDTTIMGAVSQISGGKILQSPFQAFKFPASDVVQFRALVTPCLPKCEPAVCEVFNVDGLVQESYGRKKRSIENEGLLVAKSVRITDTFRFKDSRLQDPVLKEITQIDGSCSTFLGMTIAAVLFLVAQVVILMVWSYLWHKKRATKQIEPITGSLPAEIIYGTLSSRQTSTSRLTD